MKLLIDARTLGYQPSGIGMVLNDFLIEFLKKPEFDITLLTDIISSEEMKRFEQQGVKIISYGKLVKQSVAVFQYFHFVQKQLEALQPDVFYEPNNIIPIKLKRFSGKIIVTLHDLFPITQPESFGHIYPFYFKYALKKTMKQVNGINYISMETKNEVERFFPEAKSKPNAVTYVIVNKPKFERTSTAQVRKDGYFLYIGNLERRKGTDLLLRAYQLYKSQGGTKKLYLGGKIREQAIQDLYDKISKEVDGVKSFGYVSNDMKVALFQNCDAFVFPSRAEGFGIPVIEAMYCDIPILTSNLSIFKEIAGDKVNYFDLNGTEENQIQNLANAMNKLDTENVPDYTEIRDRYLPERLGNLFTDFMQSVVAKS